MTDLTVFDLHNAMRNNFYDKKPEKYISIDEGWYKLVLDCHLELVKIDPDYRVLQIKQKFGELRYYYEPSQEYWEEYKTVSSMAKISSKYENLSKTTCEATGGSGVLMRSPNGHFKTLNPEWASQNPPYNKYYVFKSVHPSS